MPSTITRPKSNRRSRRLYGEQRPQENPVPIFITSVAPSASVLVITFDQVVTLSGTPGFTTDIAATPVSAVQTAPNVVEITFSGSVAAATDLNIGYRDPAIRNASGGWVVSNLVTI